MEHLIDDLQLDHTAPLQKQLYQDLSQRIMQGRYAPGSRLPASRQLAADQGISRNTVNAVYDQLKAEGFLLAQAGKGIFVHPNLDTCRLRLTPPPVSREQLPTGTLPPIPQRLPTKAISDKPDVTLPFTPGLPDLAAFPLRAWNQTLHHQESRPHLRGYDSFQGYQPLREAIADYLRSSRGVRCHADQVIITQGAQQALALVADVLLQPGHRVLSEDPGYRGARYALGRLGNPVIPVPLRDEVLDVDALHNAGPARLLYCTPTHQYPMGGILDLTQRLTLLHWAHRNQTWIIEDDYDSEFHFHNKPFPAIQGLLDEAPVLYLGSFSKSLLPALRVGYLIVPDALVDHFVWAKRISSGESPLLIQAVIAEFMASGQFIRHLRRMRHLYREKWNHFQALVTDQLDGTVTPVAQSAGMHLVLEGTFDDTALCNWLVSQGYGSTPLSAHFISNPERQGLVMGFASANKQQRVDCVARLTQWFKDNGRLPTGSRL